jgi:tetratricopeptide (TPR) repeat protein
VLHNRSENLANTLHSVSRLAQEIVIVDAGGGRGQAVKHLASEYDAVYLQVPADPDESALLNIALDKVQATWALFLHQQEVLHTNDPQAVYNHLESTRAIALDIPVVRFDEPGNHYLDTRLIRTDTGLRWDHTIYPSLTASLEEAANGYGPDQIQGVMYLAAIVHLGEPEPEEWELRDALVRLERELDRNPQSTRYWYHLAETARQVQEWDRAHSAVEEGLNVISKIPDTPQQEPDAVNGLIGMFCDALLAGQDYPEKTIESLLAIYKNMEGNGRFSVPLAQLLLTVDRNEDAIALQHQAVEHFFQNRRYHLTREEGLYKPILLAWEITAGRSEEELLRCVVQFQTVLNHNRQEMRPLLEYVHDHCPQLFTTIQKMLRENLDSLENQ